MLILKIEIKESKNKITTDYDYLIDDNYHRVVFIHNF